MWKPRQSHDTRQIANGWVTFEKLRELLLGSPEILFAQRGIRDIVKDAIPSWAGLCSDVWLEAKT
jgi:hypothetical protein